MASKNFYGTDVVYEVPYKKLYVGFIVDDETGEPWFLVKYIHRIIGKLGVALNKRCSGFENHCIIIRPNGAIEDLLSYEGLVRALYSCSRKSFPYCESRSRNLVKFIEESKDKFFAYMKGEDA